MEDRPFSEIASLPRLDEASLEIEWEMDRYDGPLNGLLSDEGVSYWFEYHCHLPDGERCYRLYRLSADDRRLLNLWRSGEAIFQRAVRAVTVVPNYRESAEFKAFMAKWQPFLDGFPEFDTRTPDAWCASGVNQGFYAIHVYAR